MFETAVAIAILAIGIRKRAHLTRGNLHSLDAHNEVFRLDAIGTDILDGRGTHIAGNQRQVLHAVEPGIKTQRHHLVPHDAAATRHLAAFHLAAHHGRVNHNTLEVARQQQIAAAADNQERLSGITKYRGHLLRLGVVSIFQKPAALGVNAKRVMPQ